MTRRAGHIVEDRPEAGGGGKATTKLLVAANERRELARRQAVDRPVKDVAGVWRPVDGQIEATAFHPLPDDVWDGLAAEARALLAFLADREPDVYRRYNHWWKKLPAGETRLLPGD